MTQPILEARDISMVYATRTGLTKVLFPAVTDVSLSIHPGEIVALVGESGSGKSTIGRILLQMTRPTQGTILLDGTVVTAHNAAQQVQYWKHVQLIFQDPFAALNPTSTVSKILNRPLLNYRHLSTHALSHAVEELLTEVGLTPASSYMGKYPFQLSGGQKQRVVIARALASEPRVIIADEPISMLDVSIKAGILQLMDRIRKNSGVSYLYITHDLTSAYHIADRIIVLYGGRKMEEGPPDAVINHPAHPYTHLLLESVPRPDRIPNPMATAQRISLKSNGCPFAPRCPLVQDQCFKVMPSETSMGDDHVASCHALEGGVVNL